MSAPRIPTLLPLIALGGCLFPGCGAETGNGIAAMTLALTNGDAPVVAGAALETTDKSGTRFTIQRAQAHVRFIELMLPGKKICDDSDYAHSGLSVHCDSAKIRIEGPIWVNLMDGTSSPSLANLKLPPATYKRVDVRLSPGHPAEGKILLGSRLDDHSFDSGGSFAYQGGTPTFDLRLKFDEDARFESPEGVEILDQSGQELLLLLDVGHWFSVLPITECIQDGDLQIIGGKLELEDKGSGKCSDIENALKDELKKGAKLKKK